MSSTYGENIKLSIFGGSHSPAIGMVLEGIEAGKEIDMAELNAFMARRAPGGELSTARREKDIPEFLSGIKDGRTSGSPISAIIRNTDARPSDYEKIRNIPRPGHADYTAFVKFGGNADTSGGGHFSGRLTAPMCIAGGICIQILEELGVKIRSRILSVGDVRDEGELTPDLALSGFPVIDKKAGEKMKELIINARAYGDSVGGVVECAVFGLPAGLGDPMFGGMENRIASIVFGIPAVKGIEFGAGFGAAKMRGSENNDSFRMDNGKVVTATNNCGGILGGITDGMPLVFRAAFKPTPSIAKKQQSVDLTSLTDTDLEISGRHDPCIVPRALPCVEAAAAIAIYDAYLSYKKCGGRS
jgi:chorismate synthase